MKFNNLTVFLAILFVSILAIGAVSAESYDGSNISIESVNDLSTITTHTVNDTTYSDYFEDNGVLKDSVKEGDVLIIESLTNKDLVINKAITIDGNSVGTINNGSITIGDGSTIDGGVIKNLLINSYSKNSIVLNSNVINTLITGNKISLVTAGSGYDSYSGIYTMGYVENITITDNIIDVIGSAPYNYGIDVNGYGIITGNPVGFKIFNNSITVDVEKYGAGIYLDSPQDSIISGNEIYVAGSNDYYPIYGIATADSSVWDTSFKSPKNIIISNNVISAESVDSIYAIETVGGSDFTILGNDITAITDGGAFGIAIGSISDSIISDNLIYVSGISDKKYCWDSLGTGHAGIYLQGVTGINVENNCIESVYSEGDDFAVLVKESSESVVRNNYLVSNNNLNKGNYAVGLENSTDIIVGNNIPDDSNGTDEPKKPIDDSKDVKSNGGNFANDVKSNVKMENTGLPIVAIILVLLSIFGLGYRKH